MLELWATSIPNENPGHRLDMVTLFSSMNHDTAEMEAMALHSLLEANGLESAVVGSSTLPNMEFQVQVPQSQKDEAERVMSRRVPPARPQRKKPKPRKKPGGTGRVARSLAH